MKKPTKQQLLSSIEEMIKSYEHLPSGAMLNPATNYDIQSLLLLLSAILRSDTGE